jgi:ferredoxin--NADP+ reductase
MKSGKFFEDIGLPPMNKEDDRVLICGSMPFNAEVSAILNDFGLTVSPRMGVQADYAVERAFVG